MADMLVETFEVGEVTSNLSEESTEEVRKIVDELGLAGQKNLLDGSSTGTMPYRRMTQEERNVYSALCPEKTEIKKYAEHVMPLRVLQVAAHASSLNLFKRVEVWHPTSQKTKDPVLVGVEEVNSWTERFYILARWGRELLEFSQLKELAHDLTAKQYRAKLQEFKSEIEGLLASAESRITGYVNGDESTVSPTFYK